MTSRRGFLIGLAGTLAAPVVVRAENLMKLWVPPAPKLITVADIAAEADYTGYLFTEAGKIVGWWSQKAGKIAFDYRNPDQAAPKNGVYHQCGSGMEFSRMSEILDIIGVKPYAPPHQITVRR